MSRYSLFRVLFVSMALLALVLLFIMQFVEAGGAPEAPVTWADRFTVRYWLEEIQPALIMVITTSAAIWLTLRLALRPMRRLSERAGAIGPETLDARLALEDAPAEVAPLVLAFNQSLDRLEAGWKAQRAFSAHAAHELRMPMAALRAHVESVLPASERAVATAEFDRLGRVIEQLLILAEADHDRLSQFGPVDMVALAREVAGSMAPVVLARGRQIAFESGVERFEVMGDRTLLEVALRNLIENALRHTPTGTLIEVSVSDRGVVAVRDNGGGVPAGFEERLFSRFAKSDASSEGAGLGLSIVARIMTLHHGGARYVRTVDGSEFQLEMPGATAR